MVRDDFIVRDHPVFFLSLQHLLRALCTGFPTPAGAPPVGETKQRLLAGSLWTLSVLSLQVFTPKKGVCRVQSCPRGTFLTNQEAALSTRVGPISTYNCTARWFPYGVRFPRGLEVTELQGP